MRSQAESLGDDELGLDRTGDTFQDSVLPTSLIAQRSCLQVNRSERIMSIPRSREAAKADARGSTNALRWLSCPVAICLLLGGATAWQSMFQSLWIDELHTAWACSGPWEQVVPRAAQGNQTPIYFAWQWWLGRTFGQSEDSLRITSLVAWFGALALFAAVIHKIVRRTSHTGLWWLVCLAALDRQQIFFATEARPYMAMSLVVLLGWLALDSYLAAKVVNVRTIMAWQAWVTCCAAAMWLQPTAVLFVAAQFVWAAWRTGWRWSIQSSIILALALLIGITWPLRYVLEPAWQSRQAWAGFAADLHWQNVLRQLPIVVIGVPGAIAWLLVRAFSPNKQQRIESGSRDRADSTKLNRGMYLTAWMLPLAIVILLTALEIAPLMHARYLFAATLPMTLWTATMLGRLSSGRMVTGLALGMLLLQSVQQGNLPAWLAGRLPVVERGEQWREAIFQINRQLGDKSPLQIYCASNLIEGSRSDFVDGDKLREEYLSLPLRSLYTVSDRAQIVPLLNDPRSWSAVISSQREPGAVRWLLVRASKTGLAKRLQLSGLQALEQFDFGAVQLVRF